jgi:hypothetical protein
MSNPENNWPDALVKVHRVYKLVITLIPLEWGFNFGIDQLFGSAHKDGLLHLEPGPSRYRGVATGV